MKKFSVILLAMAIAAFFAAPAMAVHVGDTGTSAGTSLTVQGKYKLDGEFQQIKFKNPVDVGTGTDVDEGSNMFMDDDFELVVTGTMGDVKGVVDFEIADGDFASHTNKLGIVDNYWVEWKFHDNWNFKAGEFGVNLGRSFAVYNGGGRNIRLDWMLEGVDLTGIYGKVVDDVYQNGNKFEEADQNQIFLGASVKAISFFSKLDFWLAYQNLMQNQETGAPGDKSYGTGLFMVDYGIPLGDWSITGEIGSFFGDNTPTDDDVTNGVYPDPDSAEGIWNITEVGWDLDAFTLGGVFFYTDKDFKAAQDVESRFDDDYAPMEWFLDEINGFGQNVTALWFTVDYDVNEKLGIGGLIMPLATQSEDPAPGVSKEDYGTEIDLYATYKLADNVAYNINFGYFSGGDANATIGVKGETGTVTGVTDNAMVLWNRLTLSF